MQVNSNLQQPKEKSNAYTQLAALLESDMQQVDQLIIVKLHSEIPLIPELAHHLIDAGGKRIRPLLTLAAGSLCNYQQPALHALAAAVEFIHTATLLHDDVVDESELRRGQMSANRLWGNTPSVLVGDFLFSRAFEMMVSTGSIDVLQCLSTTSRIISEGEVDQLMTCQNLTTSTDTYMRVIGAKTAQLFSAATEIGAILGGNTQAQRNALKDYGYHLGLAFQLVDDVMDYFAESADIGKNIGDDFKEGKMTLPVILAVEKSNDEDKKFWVRTIEKLNQNPGDFIQAKAMMHHHKIEVECMNKAQEHAEIAKTSLAQFTESPVQQAMMSLADYVVMRRS